MLSRKTHSDISGTGSNSWNTNIIRCWVRKKTREMKVAVFFGSQLDEQHIFSENTGGKCVWRKTWFRQEVETWSVYWRDEFSGHGGWYGGKNNYSGCEACALAGAKIVFSVPLEILRMEDTYLIHDNDAGLGLLHIKPFLLHQLTAASFVQQAVLTVSYLRNSALYNVFAIL